MSDNITEEIKKLAHDIKKDNDTAILEAKNGAVARAEELKAQTDKQIEALLAKQEQMEARLIKATRQSQFEEKQEAEEKTLLFFNTAHKSFKGEGEANPAAYAAYKKNFANFLKKDISLLSEAERKAMQAGVLTDGGFTIPQELDSQVVRLSQEYSKFRRLAKEKTISTDRYEIPVQTGGAVAGWVTETAARPVTNTPTVNKITINLAEMYANPAITQWYLDDPLLDTEEFVADEVAIAFAKLEDAAFINGTGVSQPTGILQYANGTAFNQVQHINAGAASFVSGATQIDGLLEMIYGTARIPDEFEASAQWLMNKATMLQIMKLKDTTNSYLWDIDRTDHYKMNLLGKAVNYSPDMPVAAANAKAVVLADFKRAYTIVNKNGTRILRDPFTAKPFVTFYTTRRCGGGLVDTQAIRILQMV